MTNLRTNFRLSFLVIVPFLMMGIVSCSDREAYYKFQELKGGDWPVTQVLSFEIDTLDVEANVPYDVSVEITNNIDYPYQNFWLFSEYNKDDSTTIKSEKEFILADEFGKWQGSGFASLYQSSHVVMKSTLFEKHRKYYINVRHGMQDEVLHGIEKVGLKITKSID